MIELEYMVLTAKRCIWLLQYDTTQAMKAAGTAGPVDNENKEKISLTVYNFNVGKLVFYLRRGERPISFLGRCCVLCVDVLLDVCVHQQC